jgi:hypothetical protein
MDACSGWTASLARVARHGANRLARAKQSSGGGAADAAGGRRDREHLKLPHREDFVRGAFHIGLLRILTRLCRYYWDSKSGIRMRYDGRLLSGVTVLMAVVEAGTMARAAEALGLTASGVGRAIARLEARIGVRLLERTTRSLRLIDEGRRFYEQVGPHLDSIEQAAMEASGAAGLVRGRLRVNVAPIVSQTLLSNRLAEFLPTAANGANAQMI